MSVQLGWIRHATVCQCHDFSTVQTETCRCRCDELSAVADQICDGITSAAAANQLQPSDDVAMATPRAPPTTPAALDSADTTDGIQQKCQELSTEYVLVYISMNASRMGWEQIPTGSWAGALASTAGTFL